MSTRHGLPADKYRYEITNGAPEWADAEKQISKASKDGRGTVVSVKTNKPKRKATETAAEIYAKEVENAHKRPKKGSKKGRS